MSSFENARGAAHLGLGLAHRTDDPAGLLVRGHPQVAPEHREFCIEDPRRLGHRSAGRTGEQIRGQGELRAAIAGGIIRLAYSAVRTTDVELVGDNVAVFGTSRASTPQASDSVPGS